MKRADLEHILRAAARISDTRDMLVIGSQSILGTADESQLPPKAVESMEVDVAFFNDRGGRLADQVDGAIGELSDFHLTFGYYLQGVSETTATLPRGWWDRLVVVDNANTEPGRGHCLEPHDCVIAKLVAGRPKDHAFAAALIQAGFVDVAVLRERLALVDGLPQEVAGRIRGWLDSQG